MKTRKKKKDRSGKNGKISEQLAERQAELERVIRREQAFRERTIRLVEGVRDALRAVNKHNHNFVCDIMAERLQQFLNTEKTSEKLERKQAENLNDEN